MEKLFMGLSSSVMVIKWMPRSGIHKKNCLQRGQTRCTKTIQSWQRSITHGHWLLLASYICPEYIIKFVQIWQILGLWFELSFWSVFVLFCFFLKDHSLVTCLPLPLWLESIKELSCLWAYVIWYLYLMYWAICSPNIQEPSTSRDYSLSVNEFQILFQVLKDCWD